jgi:hypothetical protein
MLHDFHNEVRDLKYCLCECYMISMVKLKIWNIVYVNVTWFEILFMWMLHDFHGEVWDLKYCLCECYMTFVVKLDIWYIVYVNVTW